MEYNELLIMRKERTAIVTINRSKWLNSLNSNTLLELQRAFTELETDLEVKVIILTGSGDKAFVAGADISEMRDFTTLEAFQFARLGQETLRKIETLSKPVIAVINGFALGGGCELAMACDIRLASINARFGQPEVSLGLIAGFGGTQRLPRLVGAGKAKELLYTGDIINAEEAYRIGLINHIYPSEELIDQAVLLATRIAERAPFAVQQTKNTILRGIEMDLDSAIAYENDLFSVMFSTEDQKEGCTAFVEKRKPNFIGK